MVQVAKEYTEQLGAGKIMELLESHKSYHGLYYYLGGHIAFSEDPEVGFSFVHTTLETPLPLPRWHSIFSKIWEVSMPHPILASWPAAGAPRYSCFLFRQQRPQQGLQATHSCFSGCATHLFPEDPPECRCYFGPQC